ncbi:acyl transferase [cf. Phormidesmis sp. LEGE 11477]|uniref:acyl transferase n=1 Tax=cf. Phormidesmis sp. LEGE 11477 TaxID=1828680 RepID=UPI0018818AF6|nr:acyl transferase [cf. Phormidesmis sp. LEGE 11477]MBE9063702.1 acyl transferase [cf. Phormidesmis sp. LEGE 11477]
MTLLSTLMSLFPGLIISLAGLSFLALCVIESWLFKALSLGLSLFVLYGLPVAVYQLHSRFYPVCPGISYLKSNSYSAWWGSHQIQAVYVAFPALESALRLLPGVYSVWLRLWGASVGKQVYWTPGLEIADRGLLSVGDRVIIGNQVGFYAHIVKPKKDNLLLYVKPITIADDVFVGAWSKLGPGVVVETGTYLPVGSYLYPNQSHGQKEQSPKKT